MIKLDWDSSFFDLSISSSFHEVITEDILNQSKNKMNEQLIDLCYLQSSNPISDALLDSYPIEHSSQKNRFQKQVYTLSEHQNTHIKSIPTSSPITENIYNIAKQSGHHSRFKLDTKLPKGTFEKLYDEWILQSIRRTLADEVYVYVLERAVLGLITLKKKSDRVVIGLLGVDESARGKKIGQSLIKQAENYTIQCGLNILDVSTQGSNLPAIRFYEKMGFIRSDITYIYHLWRNPQQ